MKKLIWALIFTVFTVPAFADIYNTSYLNSLTKSQADSAFDPFAKMIAQTLNSGLGDPMNIGTVKVGAEMVFVPFEKKGFISNAPVSVMPMPYVYGGVSLFDVVVFARGTIFPVKSGGKNPYIIGGGAGMEFGFTPLFTLVPVLTYQKVGNLDMMDITSFGGQIQARLNLIVISPFVNAGISYTKFDSDITILGGEKYKYDKTLLHTSVGLKVLFLVAEVGFLPTMSYTVGASFGF